MSNAKKCDRCGKFYDPFDMEGMSCKFTNPMLQTSANIREGMIGKLMFSGSPDDYEDLCPECAELFEAFMSGADIPRAAELEYELEKALKDYEELKEQNYLDYGELARENREISEKLRVYKEMYERDSKDLAKAMDDARFWKDQHQKIRKERDLSNIYDARFWKDQYQKLRKENLEAGANEAGKSACDDEEDFNKEDLEQ